MPASLKYALAQPRLALASRKKLGLELAHVDRLASRPSAWGSGARLRPELARLSVARLRHARPRALVLVGRLDDDAQLLGAVEDLDVQGTRGVGQPEHSSVPASKAGRAHKVDVAQHLARDEDDVGLALAQDRLDLRRGRQQADGADEDRRHGLLDVVRERDCAGERAGGSASSIPHRWPASDDPPW